MAGSRARQRCFLAGDRLWRPCLYRAQLYALNTSDGTVARQTRVAGEALSRPVVSDGMVLVHTSNGQLQALNETDGAVKWTVNLDMPALSLRGESAPATAYGAAIVGGDNGRVSAVLMQGADDLAAAYFYGHRPDGN